MKSTGVVRKIDELGRVVLPKELRRSLDLNEKDPMEIYVDGEMIIFKKYQPDCIFCGSGDEIKTYRSKNVCSKCLREMQKVK